MALDWSRLVPAALVLCVAYILVFTLVPFTPTIDPEDRLLTALFQGFEGFAGFSRVSSWDVISNVLLFVPYGALWVAWPRMATQPWWSALLLAGLSASSLSLVVETCQVWLPRKPSVVDVIYNGLGAVAGGALGLGLLRWIRRDTRRAVALWFPASGPGLLAGYLVILYLLFVVPVPEATSFRNWDPTLPLYLANEGTEDRAWRGELYLVAVYNRALALDEVEAHFAPGPAPAGWDRRGTDGLLVLYDFSEGHGDTVHDRAGDGAPVDLTVRDPGRVEWLTPTGLAVHRETVMASSGPAGKLATVSEEKTNAMSVEVWLRPYDLDQSGPARIVSYSYDLHERNFMLGQHRRDVTFRLRTPATGANGLNPELRTWDRPLTAGVHHLVATYADRRESLYVDGVLRASTLIAPIALFEAIINVLGPDFRWPLWSLALFPAGWLSYLSVRRRWPARVAVWLAAAVALVSLWPLPSMRWTMLSQPFDHAFVPVTLGTVFVAVFLATRVVKVA